MTQTAERYIRESDVADALRRKRDAAIRIGADRRKGASPRSLLVSYTRLALIDSIARELGVWLERDDKPAVEQEAAEPTARQGANAANELATRIWCFATDNDGRCWRKTHGGCPDDECPEAG